MLGLLHSKNKIYNINITTLADDVVFALGDYLKNKKTNEDIEDIVDLGIELCEVIIRGKKVKPEKMKMGEVLDYERYKTIEESGSELDKIGIELSTLSQKAGEIKNLMENIKKGIKVESKKVKEIQSFYIAISTPFWKNNISSFRQKKISRGLQVYE